MKRCLEGSSGMSGRRLTAVLFFGKSRGTASQAAPQVGCRLFYEPAAVLLERIRAERAASQDGQKAQAPRKRPRSRK